MTLNIRTTINFAMREAGVFRLILRRECIRNVCATPDRNIIFREHRTGTDAGTGWDGLQGTLLLVRVDQNNEFNTG